MGKEWSNNCWKSREWRLNHLYFIERKSDVPARLRLNWAQQELLANLWTRNNILKARQLGMSTLLAIYALDACLFSQNYHAGIIDKTMRDAEEKMRKINFALDCMQNVPANAYDYIKDKKDREAINAFARQIYEACAPATRQQQRLEFQTGSDIRIGTSLRGGTLQFLHISEFGHVAANFPKRANEILTGALNAVATDGIVVMESTHEGGKYGQNYRLTREAMAKVGKDLKPLDYRFFFFPWWKQDEYKIEDDSPLNLCEDLMKYFRQLEKDHDIKLTEAQKKWYSSQFNTFGFSIKQEFPSTAYEAFETQAEGSIYGRFITDLRVAGNVGVEFVADDLSPIYVSWDLGLQDYTSLWLIQPRNGKHYVLDYHCANNKDLSYYVAKIREWETTHKQSVALNFLPHDGTRRDNFDLTSYSVRLSAQGLSNIVVPRTSNVWNGIGSARRVMRNCVFHQRCSEPVVVDGEEYISGLNALENYQTAPVGSNGVMKVAPLHNICSHAADAFRCYAEAFERGFVSPHMRGKKLSEEEFVEGYLTDGVVRHRRKEKIKVVGNPFQ